MRALPRQHLGRGPRGRFGRHGFHGYAAIAGGARGAFTSPWEGRGADHGSGEKRRAQRRQPGPQERRAHSRGQGTASGGVRYGDKVCVPANCVVHPGRDEWPHARRRALARRRIRNARRRVCGGWAGSLALVQHLAALPALPTRPRFSFEKLRFVVRVNLVNYSDDFAPSRLPPTRFMLGGRGWARAGGAGGVLGLILAFSQLQETVPREAGETSDAAADSYQKLAVACLARDSLRACTHTRSPAPALPVPPVQLITGPVHHHQDLAWQSGARFPKGERSSANVSSCASVAGCAMLSR